MLPEDVKMEEFPCQIESVSSLRDTGSSLATACVIFSRIT